MKNDSNEKPEEILSRLNSETSKTFWIELLPFFAKGMVIRVSHNLDLIEVAYQLSKDNKKQIEEWMENKLISKVTDELATTWHENNMLVWTVVIKPWVLVQPVAD